MVILVSGIAESVPDTSEREFQIFTEPDIVKGFAFHPDSGLSFILSPESNEKTLLVKIPKNFPILTTREDASIYDHMLPIGGNHMELTSGFAEDECFFNYTISLQNSTDVQLLYTYPLVGDLHIISNAVDSSCLGKVFADMQCDKGHELQYNQRLEQVCINPESVEKLSVRGYLMDVRVLR